MYGLKRVVITGIGALTPAGNSVPELWDALINGKSGIEKIKKFDVSGYTTQIAGEIKNFNPLDHFNSKEVKKMDPLSQFALVSAREAVKDAGLELEKEDPTRVGVIYGSGIGGLASIEKQHATLVNRGPNKVSPFLIPLMIIDMVPGLISMEFGAKGPNYGIVSACATATHSVGESGRAIATGDADIVITGAAEAAATPLGISGFSSMKALSRNNDNPHAASRPFDLERDGFVLSEGAGSVILEEYEHAKKRGAKIYAELTGYGLTGDAYHMTQPAPGGEGGARAIELALKHAGVNPQSVDYFNAHGTSTKFNDLFETQAIKSVFKDDVKNLAVSSTKCITGHMLAAAGAVELIAVVKAMETGIIPPTWNLNNPDPECDLDYVPNSPRDANLSICMSNSLGFGGHNATVVVQKI